MSINTTANAGQLLSVALGETTYSLQAPQEKEGQTAFGMALKHRGFFSQGIARKARSTGSQEPRTV
jgi:hypothetical protein